MFDDHEVVHVCVFQSTTETVPRYIEGIGFWFRFHLGGASLLA